jgi:glutamate-1-semialdehyde aminotransferase
MFLSLAHDEADIAEALSVTREALAAVAARF